MCALDAASPAGRATTPAMPPPVEVELGDRSYLVRLVNSAARAMAEALHVRGAGDKGPRLGIVADARVWELWGEEFFEGLSGAGWRTTRVLVEPGEGSKSVEALAGVWDALVAARFERRDVVVAFGGGVVGDLAGFAAATLLRGVRLVMVPTTLLAMVDSSVGGKTGINRPAGKNLVGAFHQPAAVLIDPRYLRTLPPEEFRSGMAEVLKYGAILDAALLRDVAALRGQLERREAGPLAAVVRRCVELKARVVATDEREAGLRMILNFGHTIGHAIEAATGYAGYRHGEAVAIGMAGAVHLGERTGRIARGALDDLLASIAAFGLPTALRAPLPAAALLDAMGRDKKASAGRLRFILPTGPGAVVVADDVPEAEVVEVLRALGAR